VPQKEREGRTVQTPHPSPITVSAEDAEIAHAEAELEAEQEQLSRSVLALRRVVVNRMDWHQWVRQRPAFFLGLAFTLGFICGKRLGGHEHG
jgi:hypothetical protein